MERIESDDEQESQLTAHNSNYEKPPRFEDQRGFKKLILSCGGISGTLF